MNSHTIQGVKGSFQVKHWHVGDDIRIVIDFDDGGTFYRPTDRMSVEHLWIPNLAPCIDARIEDGEGVNVERRGDLYYIRKLSTRGGSAIFTHDQMKQIIAALKMRYIEDDGTHKTVIVKESSTGIVQSIVNGLRTLFLTGGK